MQVLTITDKQDLQDRLECMFAKKATIITKRHIENIPATLRTQNIACIVIGSDNVSSDEMIQIRHIKSNFKNIPWIVIMEDSNLEFARMCGTSGIDRIISDSEIDKLNTILPNIVRKKGVRITLENIGLDKTNAEYTPLLKNGLEIIEQDYTQLMKVGTIAELLDISESTLIREFQKYELPSPKKILMFLKVQHAIKLMEHKGLAMSEIAHLSGFTNIKRMTECFQRMYNIPPGKYKLLFVEKKKSTRSVTSSTESRANDFV